MKITHVTTRVLYTPADNPLVVGLPAPTDTREFVLLELGTDQGLVGIGLTFFGGALTPALRAAVEGLARLTIGDGPEPDRGGRGQVPAHGGQLRPGRHLRARAVRGRHGVLGPQGQGGGPLGLRAAGRPARPRAHVRERRADAAAPGRLSRQGGPAPARHGLPPDEDAVRQRADHRGLGGAGAGDARGDRPRHRPDVRHQPALERSSRDRRGPAHRGPPPLLAGRSRPPTTTTRASRASRTRSTPRSRRANTTTASCRSAICSRRARSTS